MRTTEDKETRARLRTAQGGEERTAAKREYKRARAARLREWERRRLRDGRLEAGGGRKGIDKMMGESGRATFDPDEHVRLQTWLLG